MVTAGATAGRAPAAGAGSGSNGTMARRSAPPARAPGRRSSRLAATLAPFEKPTATTRARSTP
jgi:hypothetical protein